MDCLNPIYLTKNVDPVAYPLGLRVACGKCLNCRIQKRREWSLRLGHELQYYDKSVFLTLTYDDLHLPVGPVGPIKAGSSLRKSDLQKFWKRLRKSLQSSVSPTDVHYGPMPKRRIRYYACGEYGEKSQRPHYHAIVFGLSQCPEDRYLVIRSWPYCDWSNKKILSGSFGSVTASSIAYVASYINKKYTGDLAVTEYDDLGREPTFKTSSLGIGRSWCDDNEDQLSEDGFVRNFNGSKNSLPRYYLNRLPWKPPSAAERSREAESEYNQSMHGLWMTDDELYCTELASEAEQAKEKRRNQIDRNHKAKIALNPRKL